MAKEVLAEGKRVHTTMRVPARPAYKVVAAEYYWEQVGDVPVMWVTDIGMTYPVTVGADKTVMASVTLNNSREVLNPIVTVDSYTAVAGEEVITGTVTIRSNYKLSDLGVISMTRDNPYCISVAEYSGVLVDESSSYFRAMWTIRPIIFDHADKITCRFAFITAIADTISYNYGMEGSGLSLVFPKEPPYLELTFYPPSVEVGF